MENKTPKKNNKLKKAPEIKTETMGVDIDKNEYREIVLSNSNRPENTFYKDYM